MQLNEKYSMNFSKWPLKKIMGLNILILCLVLAVGGGINYNSIVKGRHHSLANGQQLHLLSERVGNLISTDIPFREIVSLQQLTAQQVQLEILRFVLEDEKTTQPLQRALANLNKNQLELKEKWPESLPQDILKRMNGNTAIMNDISKELLEISSPIQLHELEDDARASSGELVEVISEISQILSRGTKEVNQQVLQATEVVLANGDQLRKRLDFNVILTIFNIAVILILVVISQIIFFRNLRQRLELIVNRVKDIAEGEGDLTARLTIETDDEIGQLAIWFNIFIEKIHDIIQEIVNSAETLKLSANSLNEVSTTLSSSVNEVSQSTSSVAASANGVNDSMESVAASTEQTSTNMDIIATATGEMSKTINEIANNTIKARSITGDAVIRTQKTSEYMDEFEKSAKEINDITETIADISEQTNLLALNATIEAARAGESGKGFAVVASEIKELAKKTSDATNEIRRKIEGIQEKTGTTISEIGSITKVIDEVNEIVTAIAAAVDEQSMTTQEISVNIKQSSEGVREVTRNMTQSAMATNEIARATTEISDKTNDISASSAQVLRSGEELKELSGQLLEQVGNFKVS